MQISAVSLNSPNFRASEEERRFAALSDEALRSLAWKKASVEVDDKRHRRLDNAIYCSLPIVGGISTLAQKMDYRPFKTGLMSVPPHKLRAAKLTRAGMVAGAWGVALGAVSALWGANNAAEKHIKSLKEFNKEHPVLSTLSLLTASFGAVILANRLSGKIAQKYILKDSGELLKDTLKTTKLDKALNDNKILNAAEDFIKKMPPALKDIGKGVVAYLPWIAIGTQLAHSWGHQSAKLNQVNKDYNELKTAQDMIRQNIIDEKIDQELS